MRGAGRNTEEEGRRGGMHEKKCRGDIRWCSVQCCTYWYTVC
jgi:hypothetical protein